MKKFLIFTLFALCLAAAFQGCKSNADILYSSAEGKNIGMDGYVLYGTVDTADSSTGTPVGKMIIGRLTYKSRKVSIPADHKVPHTGNFKSIRTKSFFGTEEHIVEYDFTAGNDAEAAAAAARLEEVKAKAAAE